MRGLSRRRLLRLTGIAAGAGVAGTATGAPTGPPDRDAPRPGPDLLYGPNPTPPPLENGPGWDADPLLVSGADAHVDGEYCYQDYVYDDHGADTSRIPGAPPQPEPDDLGAVFSPPTGDYVYPTDAERYRYNAADLLEFRARPAGDEVVYRVTLQTMREPDAAAVAVGVDTAGDGAPAGGRTDWGHGLGDLGAPVDHVLVTWGTGAALDGEPLADDRVSVDVERNQLEVRVPLDPGTDTWRHYCVTGLHDGSGGFAPVAPTPDATTPGGAHPESPGATPPVFNVGFRFEEPYGAPNLELATLGDQLSDLGRNRGSRGFGHGNWREYGQANALAERDVSGFHADVDFGSLRRGETRRRVPTSGHLSLLYPSRLDLGAGVDASNDVFLNRVQPYSAYVPGAATDGGPAPLVVLLHSLGGCYNQYPVYSPGLMRSLGEENGALVLMPEGRGPSGWYQREAEADVFEAWRDLERRYAVDRDRVTLSGYSMGGYGTFKLGAQYPDLFGRGFAVVGPASEDPVEGPTDGLVETPGLVQDGLLGGEEGLLGGDDGSDRSLTSVFSADPENTLRITDNLRHVPLLLWNGLADELVPVPGAMNHARRLREHGYRHELDLFPADHLLLAFRDRWDRGVDYLADGTVARSPSRVTYRRVPDFDHPEYGLVHDGAHWVQDVAVREPADSGLVDAVSHADGYAEPTAEEYLGHGTRPFPHTRRGVRWEAPGGESRAGNRLAVSLEGVESATLYVGDAGLSLAGLTVRVESDGPATLRLRAGGRERTVSVPAGATEWSP